MACYIIQLSLGHRQSSFPSVFSCEIRSFFSGQVVVSGIFIRFITFRAAYLLYL